MKMLAHSVTVYYGTGFLSYLSFIKRLLVLFETWEKRRDKSFSVAIKKIFAFSFPFFGKKGLETGNQSFPWEVGDLISGETCFIEDRHLDQTLTHELFNRTGPHA